MVAARTENTTPLFLMVLFFQNLFLLQKEKSFTVNILHQKKMIALLLHKKLRVFIFRSSFLSWSAKNYFWCMIINLKDLVTVTFTLFAIIDIVGAVPVLLSLKAKLGGINEVRATLISGALMVLF